MTTPRRPPTIPDVAREAGVSRSTASRALADYGSVSPRAREQVRAAAEKLGYRPNQLARSMITGRTHTLGVVVADIQNPFFAGVTRGITDAARAAGYQVLLGNTDEDLATERTVVKTLRDKLVDGLVVAPASTADVGHLVALRDAGCPIVLLDRYAPDLHTDAVTIDNHGATEDVVRRLLAAGHRRIALVSLAGSGADEEAGDGPNPISTGIERVNGYRSALRSAGIEDTERYLRMGGFHRQDPATMTTGLLTLPEPPTAVFATDSLIALGVLSAVHGRGLRVPDDISVVTFDDADWARVVRPPLSVVAQPVHEMGARAVRAVISRIEGSKSRPRHTTLDTEFIARDSIAPPPKGS